MSDNAMAAQRRKLPGRYRAGCAAALVLLAGLGGCAGYQFGSQSLFNTPDIETVHVPVFQSSSFRRDLGEQLTEAVVKEIEKRTPVQSRARQRRRQRAHRPHHPGT